MTAEFAPIDTGLRDILPIPFDKLPRVLKQAVPLVEEQELHPEDAISVLVVAAWTIDPKRGAKFLHNLGFTSFDLHYKKVTDDPVLEVVCDEVSEKLSDQVQAEITLQLI